MPKIGILSAESKRTSLLSANEFGCAIFHFLQFATSKHLHCHFLFWYVKDAHVYLLFGLFINLTFRVWFLNNNKIEYVVAKERER